MYLSRFYSLSPITIDCYVMFNKQAACSVLSGLDLIKHMLWVYEVTSKSFLEKRVSMELITMTLEFCERLKLAYKKNIMYEIIIQENQISHVFRNFPVYE